jgi:hypothetical protein
MRHACIASLRRSLPIPAHKEYLTAFLPQTRYCHARHCRSIRPRSSNEGVAA